MSLENTRSAEETSIGEFSILKYVKSDILVNLWLAAYFEKRIKKKQLINISIDESVQEIIRITNSESEWVPLRISCGLLTGVVKLFCHKVEYLDSKCTTIFTRMQNFSRQLNGGASGSVSGRALSKETSDSKIDRPQNNARRIKGVIDIEEINRALDDINEDAISQLEMVPLSQASQQNGSQTSLGHAESQGNYQESYELGSMPIILDMEFDDFINNEERAEGPDVEMEIEDRVVLNESGVEIDLEAGIERRRGASVDFAEVLANGLEEIGSTEREKLLELDDQSDFMDDRPEYRGSINSFKASSVSGSNRNSIGGFSASLDFLQDSGNRLSITAMAESILEKGPGLTGGGASTGASALPVPELSRSLKVSEAYSARLGVKRMKIVEISQDLLTWSRPLKGGVDSRGQTRVLSSDISDVRLGNIASFGRSSEKGVLSLNRSLPVRLSDAFLTRFVGGSTSGRSAGRRRSRLGGLVGRRGSVVQKSGRSSFGSGSIGEDPSSTAEVDSWPGGLGEEAEGGAGGLGPQEQAPPVGDSEMRTPVRRQSIQIREDGRERDELTYTPWTNYVASDQRRPADGGGSFTTSYYDERRLESLFSSREVKTMQYLESRFSESEHLSFDDLTRGSDAAVVAPIFVQILHLKSKSMIDIKQEGPFGEIFIFRVSG